MSKHNNRFTVIDGITFASEMEGRRYLELRLLLAAGEIADLQIHPRYPFVVNGQKICTYIGDFQYVDKASGKIVTEDVKGQVTAVYALKRKLFRALYGYKITEVQA